MARQVQRGQQKAVAAKIDFSRLRPGVYRAQVTVICDTCQFLVFANCKISDRVMYLEVEATAPPPPPAAARPQIQPQGQTRPRTGSPRAEPSSVMASFDPDLVPWMNAAARRAAEDAQRKADAAAAAARRAAAELDDAKKKKGPCEEELAAARAAAAAADAEAAAGAAAGEAAGAKKKAEDDARATRIPTLEEQLEAARKRCKQIYEDQMANAKKQEKALAALKKLGVLGPDAPTTGLVGMWNDWGNWATGVATGASAAAGGFAAGGKAIPTGGGPQMILGALQAAYGIFKIRLVTLTPNTKAYLTEREVYGQDSEPNQWVRNNGFADTPEEAEEVLDEMERIVNDPDTIAKDMANAMSQLDACKQEVADLEARLEAAKAGG